MRFWYFKCVKYALYLKLYNCKWMKTSYLSQKKHSFTEKFNFCNDLKLMKVQGVKYAPLEKILARTLG
jgi:hypothetical protein